MKMSQQENPESTRRFNIKPKRLRSNLWLHQLLRDDKTPLFVLVLAIFVGILSGLVGVAFEKGVNYIQTQRMTLLAHIVHPQWAWICAFIISAILASIGYFLVKKWAPEAGGSGIPEIEGALDELRPARWWRVIPVKFVGGLGTLGAGMVLGREGPTVQLCGNIGALIWDLFHGKHKEGRHTLLATGAAAGLSAAFNAPLAGVLFIIEEMRPHFRYNLTSIKAVFIGVITSSIVYQLFNSHQSVLNIGQFHAASLNTLWLYLILGLIFGIIGVGFNAALLKMQTVMQRLHQGKLGRFLIIGAILGGLCGVIALYYPELISGGFEIIPSAANGHYAISALIIIFILRCLLTLLCFTSGAPGGIFAPMLALGTLLGTAFGMIAKIYFPHYAIEPETFAIAGMGALFAASVRAPLTGIVLVLEMTDNYQLILPMIITCLGATLLAQYLGGKPIYSALLERTLAKQREQAQPMATEESEKNQPQKQIL